MTRLSLLAVVSLALLGSCGAQRQSQSGTSFQSVARFDVDINGVITVIDPEANTVRLLARDYAPLLEVGGSGWGDDQFDRPAGVWARNGIDIFIADYGNHRIQRFDRKLAFIASLSTRDRANPDERFGYPADVAVSRLGDLFICDSENARILKVSGFSKVERAFGGFDAGKGRLRNPRQLEIGPRDNVYVADDSRIIVFDTFGNYLRALGEGMFTSSFSIAADQDGLVVLSEGALFVFDANERLLQTIDVENLGARHLSISRGKLYVLTPTGFEVQDIRRSGGKE